MKQKSTFFITAFTLLITMVSFSQSTLEMGSNGGPAGNGPLTTAQAITLYDNGTTAFTPSVKATYSFSNQQFAAGSVEGLPSALGLSFGGSLNSSNNTMGNTSLYNSMNNISSPANSMFTACNTCATGTGIDVSANKAISIFGCTDALINSTTTNLKALNARVYYGDLTITFNRPVSDPILQFVGMGGTLNYSRSGKNYDMGFCMEFDLASTDVSISKLSGNSNFSVTSTQINNSATWLSASSTGVTANGVTRYGASGSVLATGTNIAAIKLKVYVRGDGGRINNGAAVVSAGAGMYPVWSVGASNSLGISSGNVSGDLMLMGVSFKKPVTVSGNVFNDANGANVNNSTGFSNPIPSGLYANLTDASGKVVASGAVNTSGTYSFAAVFTGTYTVSLSTAAGTQSLNAPNVSLPAGWVSTGEFNGTANTGTDALINGKSVAFTTASANITDINFGIQRLPESNNQSYTILPTPLNTFIVLNGTGTLANPGPLTGSDPEDQPLSGSLAGKKIAITRVPSNAQLWYNNAQILFGADGIHVPSVTNPFVIDAYNINLLKIKYVTATLRSTSTSFDYAYTDAANFTDATAATYTINWPVVLAAEALQLTATALNSSVILKWTTLSEANTAYFEVERSLNNISFIKTGSSITASVNSASVKAYGFNEDISNLTGGTVYYRVKLFNSDGTFSYSNIATVVVKNITVKVWPNPFAESIQVNMYAATKGTIAIKVNDISGRTLKTVQQKIVAGNNQVTIQGLSAYPNGIYIVEVNNNGTENGTLAFKLFKH